MTLPEQSDRESSSVQDDSTPAEKRSLPPERVRMEIVSHPRYVALLRDFIYRFGLQHGFTTRGAFDLKVIVGEALSNIIRHAYQWREDQPIFIEIYPHSHYIELIFIDFGIQRPVGKAQALDLSDYREKGLGVFLLSKLSDYHFFDQSGDRGTRLTVKKRKT